MEGGRVFAQAVVPSLQGEFLTKVGWPDNYPAGNYSQLWRDLCGASKGRHASWEEPSPTDGFMAGCAAWDVCFGSCIGENTSVLSLSCSLARSRSLILTSEGKEPVVNSFGFRLHAFSCEKGRNYEDFVSSILGPVSVCQME